MISSLDAAQVQGRLRQLAEAAADAVGPVASASVFQTHLPGAEPGADAELSCQVMFRTLRGADGWSFSPEPVRATGLCALSAIEAAFTDLARRKSAPRPARSPAPEPAIEDDGFYTVHPAAG